jgi:hypothetical protein
MWSRDSRRVYCSVNVGEIADGDGDGVYVVRTSRGVAASDCEGYRDSTWGEEGRASVSRPDEG